DPLGHRDRARARFQQRVAFLSGVPRAVRYDAARVPAELALDRGFGAWRLARPFRRIAPFRAIIRSTPLRLGRRRCASWIKSSAVSGESDRSVCATLRVSTEMILLRRHNTMPLQATKSNLRREGGDMRGTTAPANRSLVRIKRTALAVGVLAVV